MAAIFDATTGHNVTLSNGGLTVTNTGTAGNADQGVRVTASSAKTSGKYYFEITTTDADTAYSNQTNFGICTTAATYTGLVANGAGGAITYLNGVTYTDTVNNFTVIGFPGDTGDVTAIAVDLDHRLIWYNIIAGPDTGNGWNGFNGAADPALGTNGLPVPAGSLVPYVAFLSGPGAKFTANFGDSAFAGAVPSGYTAGWTDVAPPTVTVAAGGDEWPKRRKWLKNLNRVQLDEVADLVRFGITDVEDILDRVGAKKRRKKKKVPSKSVKQAKFMSAAAHNPAFAAKAGIPVSVAKEFHQADAGKKYGAHKASPQHLAKAMRGKW